MTHYHIFPLVAFCIILNYKLHNIGEISGSIHKWGMNMDIDYWVTIDRWKEGNEEHWNKESSLIASIHMRPFCWNLYLLENCVFHFIILSRVGCYAWQEWWVLVWMIAFVSTLGYTHSLNYTQYRPYSAITDLHTFQFTIAHALGFSLSTTHLLAMDLNTETITSNHWVTHSKYYT
jgi:hypothetical protein